MTRPAFTVWQARRDRGRPWCKSRHLARLELATGTYDVDGALAAACSDADHGSDDDFAAWVVDLAGVVVYGTAVTQTGDSCLAT